MDTENAYTSQHAASMLAPSPRKPLGALPTNTMVTPSKPHNSLKRAFHDPTGPQARTTPLKRSSISILNQDKGFQYLKRRRISQSPPTVETHTKRTTSKRDTQQPEQPAAAHPDSDDAAPSDQSNRSSHSFGSLINYDPSSQPPALHRAARPIAQHRGAVVLSRADTLRLALRMALYKVVTQQSHVAFPRLCIFKIRKPGPDTRWISEMGRAATGEEFGPPLESRVRSSSGEETIVADDDSSDDEQ